MAQEYYKQLEQQLEQQLKEQYNLLLEYDKEINYALDATKRQQYKFKRQQVQERINELEQERKKLRISKRLNNQVKLRYPIVGLVTILTLLVLGMILISLAKSQTPSTPIVFVPTPTNTVVPAGSTATVSLSTPTTTIAPVISTNSLALPTPTDVDRANAQKSIQELNDKIQNDPNDAFSYSNRGSKYFVLRNYVQAFADFDRGIELDPRSCGCHYASRGNAYFQLKDYQKAIDDYERAIQLEQQKSNPNKEYLKGWYNTLGLIYRDKGNKQEAKNAFQKALDLGYADAKDELDKLK